MPKTLLRDLFHQPKPVIGMAHFKAMPGTPRYDEVGGIEAIGAAIVEDLVALQEGGIDGILFCNEADTPYLPGVGAEVPTTMAALIASVRDLVKVPFGVDVMWDPCAALAAAHATGAVFVRGLFTGSYAGDAGPVAGKAGEILRYRRTIGAQQVKLFDLIPAEFAGPVDPRPIELRAKTAAFLGAADAICVSGPMTGMEYADDLRRVGQLVPDTPIIANTGVTPETVKAKLAVADGAIVGTAFKVDGNPWNPVDAARVRKLMEAARG
jgi:membrane complex biogenesis BtpA family protein